MTADTPGLPPPRPIPLKERAAMIFVEYARLDVEDGCFVAIDEGGVRTVIPVGGLACLMLEPGTRVSHRAAALAARAGTLLTWVGEGAVRLYSAGRPGGARADRLHGLTEAAVLAAGYSPAIGFLHTGKPLSFVYDIADLWKITTVVPEAFRVAGRAAKGRLEMPAERAVRHACRDAFRRTRLLEKIIPQIEEVLEAGELPRPEPPPEAAGPAFPDPEVGP